jgi:hypothetical protein
VVLEWRSVAAVQWNYVFRNGLEYADSLAAYRSAAARYLYLRGEAMSSIELLKACLDGFRSYQYGNSSTDLAKEMADAIEKYLSEPVNLVKRK